MLFTSNKYQKYGKKVIKCGDEYWDAADDFSKKIDKTIPSSFSGRTANQARIVADEIEKSLKTMGTGITSLGYSIKKVADNNDID